MPQDGQSGMSNVKDSSESLPVSLVGNPGFVSALLGYIRASANSTSLPLDETIIKSILLCIIAGHKHLILRTPEEDIGIVVKVAVWTLSYLFSYPTQRVALRSYSSNISTSAFLSSLFLPLGTYAKEPSRTHLTARSLSRAFSTAEYSRSSSFTHDTWPRNFQFNLRHDAEQLEGSRYPYGDREPSSLELPRALVLSGLEKTSDAIQLALVRMISDKRLTSSDLNDTPRQTQQYSYYSSAPLSSQDDDASWTLPPGFIMVYVCAVDAKERPAIHMSLLDRFAMSHNVQISQSARHAVRSSMPLSAVSHGNSSSYSNPNSPLLAIHAPLPQHAYAPTYTPRHSSSTLPPQTPIIQPPERPLIPTWFIETLQQYHQKAHIAPTLDLYLSDLFSAVRHHHRLDGMHLTVSARKDAEDIARAVRVLGTDFTGMELVRPPAPAIHMKDDNETDFDEASEYFSMYDTTSQNTESPEMQRKRLPFEDASTTSLLRKGPLKSHSHSRSRSRGVPVDPFQAADPTEAAPTLDIGVLDVTEGDIARAMPRVLTHRLRLRDGPKDEVLASAVVGATFGRSVAADRDTADEGIEGYGSLGIKDILVDILNKV